MSLLSICQNVTDELGYKKPSTIIGNTDFTAVRLLRAASRTGSVLATKNWHELIKTYSFSTSADEPQYAFPSDFRSIIPETIYNQTTNKKIYLISPQRWAYEKSATTSTFDDQARFLGDDGNPDIGKKFSIHPTPSAAETIYYEYYSKNWMTDASATTEKSAFTADGDLVIFDDELFTMGVLWRMLKNVGQPYIEEKTEFDQQLEIAFAQSGGTENLSTDGNTTTLSNIPETGFGS